MSMMEAVFKKQRKAFEKQVEEQNRGYRKPQKINIERNIQYGEDKLQTFDMIYPTDAKPDIPVIINIHGGGLVMGDKDFNTRFNIRMAQNGYLVISVNYRLVPEVSVFEQMQDVINGIETARKHQEEEREVLRAIWGVTKDEVNQSDKRKSKRDYDWGVPVYLTADSAGAYLALYILAVQGSPEVAREFKVRPMTTRITAAAFISGMFYTTRKDKIGLFMPKYLYGRGYKKAGFYPYINPTNPEIIKSLPATLFVTSRSDMLHSYTVDVYEAAEKYGRYCTLIDYPKNKQLTHAFSVFYVAGMSVEAISEKYQLSSYHCYSILRQLDYRKYERTAVKSRSPFPDRNRQIIDEYRNGVSATELTKKYNLTRARVYKILSNSDEYVSHRVSGVLTLRRAKIIERNKKIIADVKTHPDIPITEIASKYNISPSIVYTVLRTQ